MRQASRCVCVLTRRTQGTVGKKRQVGNRAVGTICLSSLGLDEQGYLGVCVGCTYISVDDKGCIGHTQNNKYHLWWFEKNGLQKEWYY